MPTARRPSVPSPRAWLLAPVLLLSACAPKPAVRLDYAPQQGVSALPGAGKGAVTLAGTDARAVKNRISARRNPLGIETAAIPAQNDVLQFVLDAVAAELKNRGFQVADGPTRVTVTLKKLYNTFGVGVFSTTTLGEADFSIEVKGAAGRSYSAEVKGEQRLKGIMRFSGENAKQAVEAALTQALATLFEDKAFIAALLSP